LFIHKDDKDAATKELLTALNQNLASSITGKGIKAVRKLLLDVAKEALTGSLESGTKVLPETIEVIFRGCSKNSELLELLVKIDATSPCDI
jgi:hypothetical protein